MSDNTSHSFSLSSLPFCLFCPVYQCSISSVRTVISSFPYVIWTYKQYLMYRSFDLLLSSTSLFYPSLLILTSTLYFYFSSSILSSLLSIHLSIYIPLYSTRTILPTLFLLHLSSTLLYFNTLFSSLSRSL